MLKNSLSTSGYFFQSQELIDKIEKIFEMSDINKDGKLSFTEFKQAVAKNYILVNTFWLDPNQIKLNNISTAYFMKNNPNNYSFSDYGKGFSGNFKKVTDSPYGKYKF